MSFQQPSNQWPFPQQSNTAYPSQQPFQPPNTYYPQQSPPPPQSPKKKQSSFLLPGLIIFGLMACSFISGATAMYYSMSTSSATATVVPDIAATNVAASQATQNAITPLSGTPINTGYTPPPSNSNSGSSTTKVGDTITLNNIDATLTKVKVGPVDQFSTPKPGYEFVTVHVKLKNNSGIEFRYSQLDFHAKSGTGNITDLDSSTYGDGITDLGSGTLADGGTAEGNIVFQVKPGDHKAMLTWQPNTFTDSAGDNGWLLGL